MIVAIVDLADDLTVYLADDLAADFADNVAVENLVAAVADVANPSRDQTPLV